MRCEMWVFKTFHLLIPLDTFKDFFNFNAATLICIMCTLHLCYCHLSYKYIRYIWNEHEHISRVNVQLMGGSIKSIAFVQLFSHVAVHTLYLYISWEKHKKNEMGNSINIFMFLLHFFYIFIIVQTPHSHLMFVVKILNSNQTWMLCSSHLPPQQTNVQRLLNCVASENSNIK